MLLRYCQNDLVNQNIPPVITGVIKNNITNCGLTDGTITINATRVPALPFIVSTMVPLGKAATFSTIWEKEITTSKSRMTIIPVKW
jgi:hypothetical protein